MTLDPGPQPTSKERGHRSPCPWILPMVYRYDCSVLRRPLFGVDLGLTSVDLSDSKARGDLGLTLYPPPPSWSQRDFLMYPRCVPKRSGV